MKMIDKMLGITEGEEEKEKNAEERQKDFLKEQQITDIATANESFDYQQQEARSDLLKWQQDLDDELEKLKHRLRSEQRMPDGSWQPKLIAVGVDINGKTIYNRVPPLANEIFIDYVETQVEPFLSRNLFSSNFTEKRILMMLRNTCDDIADAMADGWELYDIEFINYDLVMRLIKNVITPGPFRALNDGQRRHDRTVAKRIEAFNEKDTAKKGKKGFMGVDLE